MEQQGAKQVGRLVIVSLYGLCCLLVVIFTNSYPLWRSVSDLLGNWADQLPLVAMIAGLVALPLLVRIRLPQKIPVKIKTGWLFAACLFCIMAFFLPDPKFPVKRIHVAEYLLLAFLVRYTLSLSVGTGNLFWFTCIITALFGVHDEMLQGLHPLRTYGVRDICVNSLAGVAGACAGEIFSRPCIGDQVHCKSDRYNNVKHWLPVLLILSISLIMFIVPLQFYRKSVIPLWLLAPLAGCITAAMVMFPELKNGAGGRGHGVLVVYMQVAALLIYPVITNVSKVIFN